MKRFIEGEDRSQTALLPPSLDDYVAEVLKRTSKPKISASCLLADA